MQTFIALLRGINVGGNNRLKMKDLVAAMEDDGNYQQVKTYIQSGNIVFKADSADEQALTDLIQSHFGFAPTVMILTAEQLQQAAANNPYNETDGKRLHFYFCRQVPEPDFAAMKALQKPSETFKLIDKVFYLHAPEGIGRSKLAEKIEKLIGVAATARNLNTINKLLTML